jgi:hypothetical protein
MNPNNYATLEAAQRLLDAGIVLETDFCSDLWGDPNKIIPWYSGVEPGHPDFVPRPSMAEVWRELLSKCNVSVSGQQDGATTVWTYSGGKQTSPDIRDTNPTDALIDLLIRLTAQKEGV